MQTDEQTGRFCLSPFRRGIFEPIVHAKPAGDRIDNSSRVALK